MTKPAINPPHLLSGLGLAALALALSNTPASAQDEYYSSRGGYSPAYNAPQPYPAPDAQTRPYAPQSQYVPQVPQPQPVPQTHYAPHQGYGAQSAYGMPSGYAEPGYAQAGYDQASYGQPQSYALDDLTVRANPRYRERSRTTGAPIELVTRSRTVSYRDLDLTTPWGVNELENRVKRAARSACRELDTFHPITAAGSPPCYQDAVAGAMYQVRDAVNYTQYQRQSW